ncbi:hypothetical protein BH10PSE11_BH10PSE11_08160 [soil metagenome]
MKKFVICCVLTLLTNTTAQADDKLSIATARAAVLIALKDPSSARFEGDIVYPAAVCGLVNAKNAYGGYAGSTVYLYVLRTKELRFLTDGSTNSEKAAVATKFETYCRR